MDKDRKIVESLRKLQSMDGLSEEEFYKKKQALMRKMTAKATKFLYDKKPKQKGGTLRELAAKKEHEERMKKAGVEKESLEKSVNSRSPPASRRSTMSVVSRKSS